MKILGLNISGYISSAALASDGRIVAASCEERYTRIKRDRAFPSNAIAHALDAGGCSPEELDAVVVAWNPSKNLHKNLGLLQEANRARAKYLTYVPNELASWFDEESSQETELRLFGKPLVYIDHHLAHAASTCFTSPWDRAAVVSVDAFGENDTLVIGRVENGTITFDTRIGFPHSLGSFYSYFTEFLGFCGDADEYKVMALGAYADPDEAAELAKNVAKTYTADISGDELVFEMDLNLFDHYLFHRSHDFSALSRLLGMAARRPNDLLEPRHFALAHAVQYHFEKILDAILSFAAKTTGESLVCLSGGCFMNSLANGKLARECRHFKDMHIPPYPDDSGTAIGAALYGQFHSKPGKHRFERHNFFGPQETTETFEALLSQRKIPFLRLDDPAAELAERLERGEIVGHVSGPMEFGQRALGNRSIFADPRLPDVRDKINESIKNREWFRPYAASVLAEEAAKVFDVPKGFRSDFMEKVVPVRSEWAERIKGLLHADGTVRLQTVEKQTNPRLYAMLRHFFKRTGVPLVLNTSFNVKGEPIVLDGAQAIRTFYSCGLDTLILDNLCIVKQGNPPR